MWNFEANARALNNSALISKAKSLIAAIGGDTYIVGGAVRDMVMGRINQIKDIDIATNVDIEDLCNRFNTHDIGKNKDFGIVVISWEGIDFEVAHFRKDGQYSDNRRPDSVEFVQTIEEDLARRDFTINAMAFDGKNIIDPFGGTQDIEKGVIRFVGKAEDRLNEDRLRILRAYRFAGRYQFDIVDEHVMEDFDLEGVSQERITDELRKSASDGGKALAFFMDRTKRQEIIIIPEIQEFNGPHQVKHHPEGGVFEHIIHCLCASDSTDYLTNLSILFHDIGKQVALAYKNDRPIYYGHDNIGVGMIRPIGERMKLSNEEIECLEYICEYHMVWWELPNMKKSKMINIVQNKYYPILSSVTRADENSRLYLANDNRRNSIATTILTEMMAYGDKQDFDNKVKSFVTGEKIMMLRPGITGKEIGKVKTDVIELLINRQFNIGPNEVSTFILNYKFENGQVTIEDVPSSAS